MLKLLVIAIMCQVNVSILTSKNASELILCANQVLHKHFDASKPVVLIGVTLNYTELDEIEFFFLNLQLTTPFYIYYHSNKYYNIPEVLKQSTQLIIFANSEECFRDLLNGTKREDFAPDTKMLIVVKHSLRLVQINNMLAECWKNKIWKVILLIPSSGGVSAYANNLFDRHYCDHVRVELSDYWSNNSFQNNVDLFSAKVKNMHGCPISFAANNETLFMKLENNHEGGYNIYGIESEIILLLKDFYNFTIKVLVSEDGNPWGSKLRNGSFTGLLHLLDIGKANVAVGGFFITSERAIAFDCTKGYHTSDVVWAVSNRITDGPWNRLTYPFQTSVWIILVILFVILVIGITAIRKYYQRRYGASFSYFVHNSYTVSNMIALLLGQQIRIVDQKFFRYFMVIFLLSFSILRASYQDGIVQFLTSDTHITHPNTQQEMEDEDYSFVINVHSIPEVAQLYPNFKTVQIDINIVYKYLRSTSSAHKIALPFIRESIAEENQNNLHLGVVPIADEVIQTLPVVMYLEKSSPYSELFNSVIGIINSAGLMEKFIKKYFKSIGEVKKHFVNDEPVTILLKHFTGHFLIYIIGASTSIFIFIIELANYKCRNNVRIVHVD